MSEQRVVYLSAVSVEMLVVKMNELLCDLEIDAIEHFAIVGDKGQSWEAVVLVRIQHRLHLGWQVNEGEEVAIEARQEYETVIGVKPR